MAYVSAFTDRITVNDGGTAKTIYTMDDYTYGGSRTEIQIKTRGSETVRYIAGMLDRPVSFTVYAGTDPEDANSFDAFAFFKTMFDSKTTKSLTILGDTNNYICTSFEQSAPVDGLKTATVTLKISGATASSSSSSSSQS